MLIKLLPENITSNWDTIKYAIENSLPPTIGEGPDKMNRILESLLSGDLSCWIQHEVTEQGIEVYSIGTTRIVHDAPSNTKVMLMYSVYNYKPMTDKMWAENLITLKKYAAGEKCARIVAYTDVERMITLCEKLGGEAKYTLCSFPTNPLH